MKKRSLFSMLACMLLLSVLFAMLPQRAMADELQDQIDELRRERLAIAEEHEQKQAVVDELESEKASVVLRKQAMDERNALTQKEIETLQKEIAAYGSLIVEKQGEVEKAKALEAQQLERYRVRVRAMEESGDLGYLDMLLQAGSLSELLTAVVDAGDVMRSDKELYDSYIAARQNTETAKADLEQTKAGLEEKQTILVEKQAALQAEIQEAAQLILTLEQDIDKRNEELHNLLLAEIETAERIDSLVAEQERIRREEEERQRQEEERRRQEEEARQQAQQQQGTAQIVVPQEEESQQEVLQADAWQQENSGTVPYAESVPVVGTGSWAWPCPGCTYVTSKAGNRFHPIFGQWKYHSGMDIGAAYGSAVTAADSGMVIMASFNGGYGNCVMIDHGNGYYSLYGHLCAYAVNNGQCVLQGQTIGYVGESGWSTGPHLHFEVREGNTSLDPEAVCGFSGLTYAPDAGD